MQASISLLTRTLPLAPEVGTAQRGADKLIRGKRDLIRGKRDLSIARQTN
jgi:hypothetical protein